jgi:hypothetical protein
MRYTIYTLVDITNTGQYRNDEYKQQARSQQQNFDTVVQTVGMRSNLYYDYPPKVIIDKPEKYGMKGKDLCNIWVFEWNVELEFVFIEDGDDVALLKKDFDLVPYIAGLTETIKTKPSVFRPGVNISFEMLR